MRNPVSFTEKTVRKHKTKKKSKPVPSCPGSDKKVTAKPSGILISTLTSGERGSKKKKKTTMKTRKTKKKQTIPVIGVSDLLDTYSKMIVDSGRYTCKSMRNKKRKQKAKGP